MPIFKPLAHGLSPDDLPSDLDRLVWMRGGLAADFFVREGRHVRVAFARVEAVRTIDETFTSTEEDEPSVGLIPTNFAYQVEGARFWRSQSALLGELKPRLKHFAFLTGWTCLDVLSEQEPEFTLI